MIALVAMLVYTAGFVSWGPVTWVLLSEIFPNQIRGKAMASPSPPSGSPTIRQLDLPHPR